MAYAALVSLCQLLDHTLHHDHKYFYVPRGDDQRTLESIHEKSSFLLSFLDDHSRKGGETVQSLEVHIRNVAYRAQDIIEWEVSYQIATSIEHHGVKKGCFQSILTIAQKKKQQLGTRNVNYKEDLQEVLDQFDRMVGEAKNIQVSCSVEEPQISAAQTPALASSSQAGNSRNEMVGYEQDLIGIQERLCGESTKLKIIPIVGMGGIGKTTLARNLFDDSLIEYHFHTRAWGTISQQYHLKGLLLGILHSLTLETEELAREIQRSYLAQTTDESLKESIYRSLKGKRYLIILDDMWSTEAWDDLRMIFPDDNNGSRIIITSRLINVAEHASSSSPSHQMHLLNEDESWNLLQEKVFADESCPPELEDIGKTIAKKCSGLPLAILVVAGILTEVALTEHHWKNVADNVSAAVATADGNFSKILSLSYKHLPNYLKTCFLYIGAFSEGYEIPISNLIKLWVAEGFLKPIESKSLEEAAEDYLEDLVKRNLITKTKKTWTGRFKSCGMHDILRDLCIQKAEEEKFIVVVDKNVYSRGADIAESRRLAICYGMDGNVPNNFHVRSILQFNFVWELSSLLSCSRILRVLSMPNAWLRSFPDEITEMFHLRYLAFMYIDIDEGSSLALPSTLSKLQNLQTLLIHRDAYVDAKSPVPLDIWKLPLLRHIILKRSMLLFPPPPRNCSVLENLQTVSKVLNFELTRKAISKIPNVKELKLVYTSWALIGVRHLVHFLQLEKLKVDLLGTGMMKILDICDASKISVPFPVYYAFPASLKRLCLRGCRPPCEDMSVIGQLPNLEVLKLIGFDFVDRCWETKEGEFKSLRFLKIDLSNIINWRAESSHFPRLEHLIIQGCGVLEEVPFGIGDIGTLKIIGIGTCSQSAVDSAVAIQEEQENLGNEELVVKILSVFA